MKAFKLTLVLVALVCTSICTAFAVPKLSVVQFAKLGVPYSLEYIAKHSDQKMKRRSYGELVTYHESGATQSVYRTYDWEVEFVQNGSIVYSFSTNDSYNNWNSYNYNDEIWLGSTASPAAGTYTVIIQNISGVGGTYEAGIGFTNSSGQNDSVWSNDVITSRSDIVLPNVDLDGTSAIDIVVNKTQY